MAERDEAVARWRRIARAKEDIDRHMTAYPISLPNCAKADFHFNKGSLDMPFLPMWTLKAKGRTFYVHHLESAIGCSSHETPEASTKGAIRFRNCRIDIDASGKATILGH